ncbi:MAG: exonuclease SbcCD subunit D [Cyanobacteria bacterium SZAS LIN-2]|nr:exonuclease SbcCD subunit D [Cyanobacteria bacterium SZAS LIN-3]MBS1999765.1 exonuclease SbcCD subunit D [Cyanobacteria bacterium SZAS LIN-2]MBS2007852.1 exonuclease SbcCD subunit D [Cyanobacteria bacterium SZAS TMP-1]
MAISLIHVSDIHFGSGESHGRINSATGLNVRFEDFVLALSKVVDFAISKSADIFLFSGDAYRNASPDPIYQKMFALQLKRLSDANIQTILVVGNHDQLLRSSQSHAMSVFQSLEVPGVMTIDRPMSIKLDTKNGALQLIGLPHITRHQLMTLDKYKDLSAADIDRVLVDHIRDLLRGHYLNLDENIPTVVTAHMATDSALAGIEEELLVGYTLTFPTEMFVDHRVDYVALGHIHKYQILRPSAPAIVYAGSLERVDFGEEKEDKGFVHVEISRGKADFKFHSIDPRPFITVDADVCGSENPTEDLLAKIIKACVPGCVLRVRYKIDQDKMSLVDEDKLRNAADAALSVKLHAEIMPSHQRARMPQLNENAVLSPLTALDTYLTEVTADPVKRERLLNRAKEIMQKVTADISGDKEQGSGL